MAKLFTLLFGSMCSFRFDKAWKLFIHGFNKEKLLEINALGRLKMLFQRPWISGGACPRTAPSSSPCLRWSWLLTHIVSKPNKRVMKSCLKCLMRCPQDFYLVWQLTPSSFQICKELQKPCCGRGPGWLSFLDECPKYIFFSCLNWTNFVSGWNWILRTRW